MPGAPEGFNPLAAHPVDSAQTRRDLLRAALRSHPVQPEDKDERRERGQRRLGSVSDMESSQEQGALLFPGQHSFAPRRNTAHTSGDRDQSWRHYLDEDPMAAGIRRSPGGGSVASVKSLEFQRRHTADTLERYRADESPHRGTEERKPLQRRQTIPSKFFPTARDAARALFVRAGTRLLLPSRKDPRVLQWNDAVESGGSERAD